MDERRHNMDGALFVDEERRERTSERERSTRDRGYDDGKAETAQRVTQGILDRMDLEASVHVREDDEQIVLDIDGPDAGRAIGKKGMTLEALQFLVNKIVNRDPDERRHIVLDSGDYRERHDNGLVSMAKREAKRAISSGRAVTLEPMSARDRRVIHVSLAKFPGVSTRSEGEGMERRLQIIPARGDRGRDDRRDRPTMRDERGPRDERAVRDERGPRDERAVRDERGPRDERAVRDERSPRDERAVRDERSPRDERAVRDERSPRDERAVRDERGPRDERAARDERGTRDARGVPRDDRSARDERGTRDERARTSTGEEATRAAVRDDRSRALARGPRTSEGDVQREPEPSTRSYDADRGYAEERGYDDRGRGAEYDDELYAERSVGSERELPPDEPRGTTERDRLDRNRDRHSRG